MTTAQRTYDTACELAEAAFGVVSRHQLRDAGVTRHQIRTHVDAGRFRLLGCGAVHVLAVGWCDERSPIVTAVANAGPSAWADGESALILAGLRGWTPDGVHVSHARTTRVSPMPGVEHHTPVVTPTTFSLPARRAHPAMAAIRAASWARSDRAAATLLSMTVQQRLARPEAMLDALRLLPKVRRRALIAQVLGDVADGSQSLGELDFIAMCRRRGLPKPDRQVLREAAGGRLYLDVYWSKAALVVEIDGAHHVVGDNPWRDALRQNTLSMRGDRVLRIPVIALRVQPDPFFQQIESCLAAAGLIVRDVAS